MHTSEGDAFARRAIWPGDTAPPAASYSPAIAAGGWIFVAGQLASDFVDGVAEAARPPAGHEYAHDPLEFQTRFVMENLRRTLAAGGADLDRDVVHLSHWLTSEHPTPQAFAAGDNSPRLELTAHERTVYGEFVTHARPSSIVRGVRQLLTRGTTVEVDVVAIPARDGVVREQIPPPDDSPGACSPGVRVGDWVFLSGDATATLPRDASHSRIEAQTETLLGELERAAQRAGASLQRCVKATVHLGHPKDFAGMDRVWRERFPDHPPARVVVPFMGFAGEGCRIGASLKLLHSSSRLAIEPIVADDALAPFGHEPQAVKAGDFVFFSTQVPGLGGELRPPLVRDPAFPWMGMAARAQVDHVLENVSRLCEKAGTELSNIVRRRCFHEHFVDFAESIDAWARHFPEVPPASTTIEVGGPLLVSGAKVLYDLVAYAPAQPESR